MADAASWRLTVAIPAGRAKDLREQLEQTPGLDLGSNDDNLYLYAPSREAIEASVPAIRSAMDAVAIKPTSIEIDQWLDDAKRWSSEAPGDRDPDDDVDQQGWLTSIFDGLTRSSPI